MRSHAIENPPELAVTIEQAKTQIRITVADHDLFLAELILTAQEHVERELRLALVSRKWKLVTNGFGCQVELVGPFATVHTVTYLDTDGVEQTLPADQYRVADSSPPLLVPAHGAIWPETLCTPDAVRVVYTAGYGTRWEMVPSGLRHAIRMLVGHWFENPEAYVVGQVGVHEIPQGFEALLMPFRRPRVG